ncbi:MerC domain-containing protein [Tenacibaculum aiptasiae]|uniref:MerC domain-containing protein n=1 Tax=Tenacibaculum aiptasiae TaxID=426481 RepID=A0A7J5APF8_9FLAO|nr:MerC domain-containing protein [Tenacibaculum aiptasiae]KAB1159437.1 MerC domain-containing protein [Tenacibaculum aiptasiae]
MKITLAKPDTFGAFASGLCMIHCIATPFLFIVQTCATGGCENAPTWWKSIDYVFLAISFLAIYRSAETTTNKYIKPAFWVTWALLLVVILNEKLNWISIPEYAVHIPATILIVLHVYNLKYCQCKSDKYTVNHE